MTQTGSALDTEWSLLGACCSGAVENVQQVLRSGINWAELFALADQHGVESLLFQTLSNFEDAVPDAEMRALKLGYQKNLHKSLFLSRELIRIVDCLNAAGLEVVPYKGPALAEALYGDIALRASGDLDLLIRRADLSRVRETVRELGYVAHWPFSPAEERAFLESGYECVFDGPAGPHLLEVQWELQPRFYAVDFDIDGLFSRAVTIRVAGRQLRAPSAEDLMIVLSVHASKHVWGRLIWLCDIARVLNLRGLDWKWIGSQASELGIVRILRTTLLLANRLLRTSIPEAVEEYLPEDRCAAVLAGEIQARITGSSLHDVESLGYFRLMLRLRERQSDRLRFLRRLILTPGPGEWACIKLREPFFPLYRVVRLSRLAARFLRR